MSERSTNITAAVAIVLLSTLLGTAIAWSAPGIDQYFRDWLTRARGSLAAPDDIVIVAIDEASIQEFGRFPWSRELSARAIDAISAAQPKVIALDVLYSDPTSEPEDNILTRSVQQAGNVVVAAQLVAPPATGGPARWLLPLPKILQGAAAVGHVNVSAESDGVARQILIRVADDQARAIRAMAVEVVRVGDGIPERSLSETSRGLLLGSRVIAVERSAPAVVVSTNPGAQGSVQTLPAERLAIDYIGPPGSFRTYSFADVIRGRISPARFRGNYVLVGATAASLGDRLASPFAHQADATGNQHGSLMPGVEVLANALNTILRSRFYSELPDWLEFLCGALVAALTLFLLAIAQGDQETIKQIGALAATGGAILVVGYAVFTRLLVFPPLTVALVSFASASTLGSLRRSLVASAQLDRTIDEIKHSQESPNPIGTGSVADSIARLADADAVAIYSSKGGGHGRLVAACGVPILRNRSGKFSMPFPADHGQELLVIPVDASEATLTLVISHEAARAPSIETQRICAAIAGTVAEPADQGSDSSRRWWPRGLAWKAQSLRHLNRLILDRAKFGELAMRSIEDALIIAGVEGRITFANRRAQEILDSSEHALQGRDLFELLANAEHSSAFTPHDVLARLVVDRAKVERDITIRGARPGHFILRIAAVCSDEGLSAKAGQGMVRGIVASLSDITRQSELQRTKNDVIALVSHEMRTPLTAIQGMSELLAQYEIDPDRSREMSLAIHDEAKRLTRMISEYLDITRLESGATLLRRSVVRVEAVVERALLMLEPLAAKRGIRLIRRLDPNVPPVLADADLISRAIGNLVANAIKYSPPHTEVVISAKDAGSGVLIVVTDQGYGIPEASIHRVFEKFYRVPRAQDVDVPGTGLGLALVREIIELHGGSVTVHSPVGAGSVFTLRIPSFEDNA